MSIENTGFASLCGFARPSSAADGSGAVSTPSTGTWLWGGAAIATVAVAGILYQRSKVKEEARKEASEDAVELRGAPGENQRARIEEYKEAWEREHRTPFPYEIDAYGRVRPEGSREQFEAFPANFSPTLLTEILEEHGEHGEIGEYGRKLPSGKDFQRWMELAPRNVSRDAVKLAKRLRQKGVGDPWGFALRVVGESHEAAPRFRTPEHFDAFVEIAQDRFRSQPKSAFLPQSDPRWLLVENSKHPLEHLRRIEDAMMIARHSPRRKDVEDRLTETLFSQPGAIVQRRKLRRLIDLKVAPEALLAAMMYGAYTESDDPRDFDTVDRIAIAIDKNVSKIKSPEDRRRVAAAAIVSVVDEMNEETGKRGDLPRHERAQLAGDRLRDSMDAVCALWPAESCVPSGDEIPLSPVYPLLRGVVAAKMAIGKPFHESFRKIPRKFVLEALRDRERQRQEAIASGDIKIDPQTGKAWGLSRLSDGEKIRLDESDVRSRYVASRCADARESVPDDLRYAFDGIGNVVRDRPAVAEWLAGVCQDKPRFSALTHPRDFPMPGGQQFLGRYLERIDEVQDVDIQSPRDSVNDVFRRAAERVARQMKEKYLAKPNVPLREIPPWWPVDTIAKLESKGVKLRPLLTARELAREGAEMDHCAGSYCPMVEGEEAMLASLTMPSGERTTLDFSREGVLRQNFTYANSQPSEEAVAIGKALEEEAREKYKTDGEWGPAYPAR